jgi:hypothetical protein
LTTSGVHDALKQAVAQWQSTGLTVDRMAQLSSVQVQGASLPGTMLGYTLADSPVIYIDFDAAGHGWNVGQATRALSGEPDVGNLSLSGSRLSTVDSQPAMDLVTVLTHELGHVLGHDHGDDHGVMSATLGAGERTSVIRDQLSVISDRSSVISDELSAVSGQESGVSGQGSGLRAERSAVDDAWSTFGDFDTSHPASRIANPGSANLQSAICNLKSLPRVTDALFARLDDRAGAITDNDDSLIDEDRSSVESEDGLDLWAVLFGLE